ncbi:response regulator [Cellulomonas fimi]|uniref:Response regulator receiver protein n=1 Tax=Cellulomonas fimi (strain ATCC 484 / DSM 20113 / JCM 1341 / CCUG 24087 / LMG 16345 / NBRC 15513 / NCIMB 8980 / NCTC 7547 / NRS-133) TaxID=590998 RepID=F4H039_CELFA|nr:response regulator [Cellulomonas fimi]AEE44961.1 response regulator receiver protein [Cellulomonas fimi ATCC 484]NNH07215.1 response regulator [Cellulomonas fimi]VEH27811.1 Transcriptional regulatory protein ZraR [Cellulomonas fimi]
MSDDQVRVLVVEDDVDTAQFVRTVLERRGGMAATVVHDPMSALAEVAARTFDVVVTDIQMPGMSGLDLLGELRARAPGVPVAVMTAFASVDYAVEALRRDADEFLVKPVGASVLVEKIGALAAEGRRRREAAAPTETVLAVGAHPDDVEIGIGATLASHRAAGDAVVVLTLSSGAIGGEVDARRHEALAAAAVINARLYLHDFEDTRLDPANGLITTIEDTIREVSPTVVYTHSVHDRHQDHRAVHQAVQVAARRVPSLACFQSPSSTVEFRPDTFVPVDGFVETKLAMLAAFESQAHRDYMEPDLVRATARYWSRFGTGRHAEPLETVRVAAMLSRSARAAGLSAARDDAAGLAHDETGGHR